jgi:hypothetical protein
VLEQLISQLGRPLARDSQSEFGPKEAAAVMVNILEADSVDGCGFRIGSFSKVPNELKILSERLGRNKQKNRSNQLGSRIKQSPEGTSLVMRFRASKALTETQFEWCGGHARSLWRGFRTMPSKFQEIKNIDCQLRAVLDTIPLTFYSLA